MTRKTDFTLYRAAVAADEAWSNELHRLFGKNASTMRYKPAGQGAEGSTLRQLYDAFRQTSLDWREYYMSERVQ